MFELEHTHLYHAFKKRQDSPSMFLAAAADHDDDKQQRGPVLVQKYMLEYVRFRDASIWLNAVRITGTGIHICGFAKEWYSSDIIVRFLGAIIYYFPPHCLLLAYPSQRPERNAACANCAVCRLVGTFSFTTYEAIP